MLASAPWVVFGTVMATLLSSWIFFHRFKVLHLPMGVINLRDVAFVLGVIVTGTYLNSILPGWLIAGLFTLCALSLLGSAIEPVVRARWMRWLLVCGLIAGNIGSWAIWGAMSRPFLIVNNLVLLISIVSITNLWAQGGLRARDLALLAAGLTIYDVSATWLTTMTAEAFHRLATLPFAPLVAWPVEQGVWLGVGVGDIVIAALSPLVLTKAFTKRAGVGALTLNLGLLAALLLLAARGVQFVFPAMLLLGPLIVMQYGYWSWRCSSAQPAQWAIPASGTPY